jgi:hypothetical protein
VTRALVASGTSRQIAIEYLDRRIIGRKIELICLDSIKYVASPNSSRAMFRASASLGDSSFDAFSRTGCILSAGKVLRTKPEEQPQVAHLA